MKFLTLLKFKPGMPPGDPQMAIGMNEAVKGWIQASIASGKLDNAYNVMPSAQNYYGMGVGNANSLEEVFEFLTTYPGYLVTDFEVYPLTEVNAAIDNVNGALRKVMGG